MKEVHELTNILGSIEMFYFIWPDLAHYIDDRDIMTFPQIKENIRMTYCN